MVVRRPEPGRSGGGEQPDESRPAVANTPRPAGQTLDLRALLEQFERREIDAAQVVRRLLATYQLELGATVLALRELDRAVAQEVGEKLKQRIESFLAEFERPVSSPIEQKSPFERRLLDKDTQVLQRELIVFRQLLNPNAEVEFGAIFTAAKAFESGLASGAMTMTLKRLVKEGLVLKRRKGRYQGTAATREQAMLTAHEIEARAATMPPV